MPRTSTVLTVAGVTTVAAAAAYAVWFDQKRRNDADFRKKLRKEKKKVNKTAKLAASQSSAAPAEEYDFAGALEQLRKEPMPSTPLESEQIFLESVETGDRLSAQGPLFYFPAAVSYYRALTVYPMPTDLLGMYKENVVPPVFTLVIQLMNHDLQSKAEGYWAHWPPKSMHVRVDELPLNKDGKPVPDVPGQPVVRRRGLVATKDFTAGDVIYQEQPVAAILDLDLEGKGTHCSHCLRELSPMMSIAVPNDPASTTYCSKACQLAATSSWHNVLFGNKSIALEAGAASSVLSPAEEAEKQASRRQAQEALVAHVKSTDKVTPILLARFVARMISGEMAKVLPSEATPPPPNDLPEPDDGFSAAFYDHVDRLRFLEVPEDDKDAEIEGKLLRDMLNGAMVGLDEFLKSDRYLVLKGKVLFNAIGITFSGGRLDKPRTGARFEPWDLTRTPYGTSRQTGSGFYRVSSYLAHSCSPSVRPSFPKGTSELHLIANRDIKAGEELTMSYVRSSPAEGQTALANRLARRQELARGWRFPCECVKCAEEAADMDKLVKEDAEANKTEKVEVKVEEPVPVIATVTATTATPAGESEELAESPVVVEKSIETLKDLSLGQDEPTTTE